MPRARRLYARDIQARKEVFRPYSDEAIAAEVAGSGYVLKQPDAGSRAAAANASGPEAKLDAIIKVCFAAPVFAPKNVKVWLGFWSVLVPPSPKLQEYVRLGVSTGLSVAEPVKLIAVPGVPL